MIDLVLSRVRHLTTTSPEEPDRPAILDVSKNGAIAFGHLLISALPFANIKKEVALSSVGIPVPLANNVVREDDYVWRPSRR